MRTTVAVQKKTQAAVAVQKKTSEAKSPDSFCGGIGAVGGL